MGVKGIEDLKKLQSKLEQLQKKDLNDMYEYIARQVALRFLMYVIPDTPVQRNQTIETKYKTYKVQGGALRRGWIGKPTPGTSPSNSEIMAFANNLPVTGDKTKSVTISNNVEYALIYGACKIGQIRRTLNFKLLTYIEYGQK